ncbi:phosphoglycerate mutase [Agrilutibacter solisilvae]|uniref:Phosphoglycerate mutase n=1 Tax=Agrilutibacter solisilvae TaxID=2763317 RepID=A0A974XXB6_9GAMM|nr:phosphoglycerate mutase [Lysobacter solisilvae]QSX77546.1 phosphoglycerate mutase [Lysobacter solisilvae]
MKSATLLLPDRARFGAQRLAPGIARAVGQGDRIALAGEQRARVFDILPRGWPVAAVTRQRDAGDASLGAWLRADPAHVRPDINGARLLAYGSALELSMEDCQALLRPLQPLFGDTGFPIDAPTPSRWYLRLPRGAKLPAFTEPEAALGSDLFEHLPEGPEGRRWRALLSEAQVTLHNHPVNARRIAAGLAPVNSLWFWGASASPDHVRTGFEAIHSEDDAFHAFAFAAGLPAQSLPARWPAQEGAGASAFDLRHVRDLAALQADWIDPMLRSMQAGGLRALTLDFEDGIGVALRPGQRWRFWRRPVGSLSA